MSNRKNIPLFVSLLLWAVLLCTLGCLRTGVVSVSPGAGNADTAAEQITAEGYINPVAWAESSTPTRATTAETSLTLLYKGYGLQRHICVYCSPEPACPGFVVSSLSQQFRILPNAP